MLLREVGYARPPSIAEAIRLLAETDGARPLAGGQTIVNVMKARAASPDALVDLALLDGLRGIELGADGGLELGAMTTYAELVASAEARARPILGEVCAQIADVQVRNRGTIGGNICANDPTNHLPPLMVALGARMTIMGPGGSERTVGADDFFLGVYMTAVGPGELLTRISIPPGRRDGFASVTIGRDGTCIVSAAASLEGGARVAIGCVDAVPHRATDVEAKLTGATEVTLERARDVVAGLGETLDPPGDVHATAAYRRRLAEVVAGRALVEASERGARA
jgi:carbon-monoxide dehydrogenase medium subunit